jgi:LysR family glycine cleavage system transcriptional activator
VFDKLPPLHALAAFEAAARHLSFTKAAEELCRTQSAVSRRIRQLERHLGAPLFLRSKRSVALTPQGRRLLDAVREALRTLQAASDQIATDRRPTLRLSVAPAFASNWLIQRIGGFQRQHPDLDLEIQATSLVADLRVDPIDVAIRYGHADWPGARAIRLMESRLVAVCSADYRKALGRIEGPQVLDRVTLLRHAMMPWPRFFQAVGHRRDEPVRGPLFSEVSLMLEAAASSQGVALAPMVLVRSPVESRRLVRLLDAEVEVDATYYAVFLPDARERPAVRAFIDWVVKTAAADELAGRALDGVAATCGEDD